MSRWQSVTKDSSVKMESTVKGHLIIENLKNKFKRKVFIKVKENLLNEQHLFSVNIRIITGMEGIT
jgi:hypothetical protein